MKPEPTFVMKLFHCDKCEQLLYFENTSCVNCGTMLAYLPDVQKVNSLEPTGDGRTWLSDTGASYRLCQNYVQHNVCNWAIPVEDNCPFCLSCRLTRTIPNLLEGENCEAWFLMEGAKRRLVYSLLALGLPVKNKLEDPQRGLVYDFLADLPNAAVPVLTGHDEGVIVINLAEANAVEREKRRLAMHEPYRTLVGHFRHEVGHYYWDLLIKDSPEIEGFRELFGDERADYDQALQAHYQNGAPVDWPQRFISAYATSHPWEDWAETWAHYLHMADALETAAACGLSLAPLRPDEPSFAVLGEPPWPFEQMIESWFPLTHVLNNLNRGLGLKDGYPFVLSNPVIDKLRYVHGVIARASDQVSA
jgi:hypothetical protein